MSKQLRSLFAILLLFTVILSGCSNDEGKNAPEDPEDDQKEEVIIDEVKTPVEGGTLQVGVLQLPTWNPFKWQESTPAYSTAERLVYRGLFTYGPDHQWMPDLIKNYSIDQSEGKSTLRFTLDDQVKWQDGTPLSYDDIAFTLQTYLDPFYYGAWKQNLSYIEGTSPYRSGKKEQITGIKQDENGEIIIEAIDANSSFYHALTAPILPAHQLKGLSLEEINQQLTDGKVVGNGPYKFASKTDTELQLSRALAFAEGGPYLDGIVFQLYNGEAANLSAEQSFDLLEVPPQKEQTIDEGYKVYDVTQNLYYYLGFNFKDPVLGNKEIRSAIFEAMDRNALIDQLFFGHGAIVNSILPLDSWLEDHQRTVLETNVEAAKSKMEAMGYTADKPLTISIHYQGDLGVIEKLVDSMSNQLAAIHVKIEKKPLSGDEYYQYLFSGKSTQAFIHAWPFSKDIGYWWKLYGSYHDVKDLGLNVYHYDNAEADKSLKELYSTPPSATQKETAIAFLNKFDADRIVLPLFAPNQSYWVSKRVHDQVINADRWFIDITKWWLEK